MTRHQIIAIALCFLLNMVDGYDVLVMPFAAPGIADEWGVGNVLLGYLLSGSLIGMAIGSYLLAPVADFIGRRNLTLVALSISVVGMGLSIFAGGPTELLAYRIIAGIGIGGMISNLSILVNEYSNEQYRGVAVGLFTAGYPIGATAGGALAGVLIANYGWRDAFVLGTILPAVLLILCVIWLPESYDYLIEKGGPRSLTKLNKVLEKLGQEPMTEIPQPAKSDASQAWREVIRRDKLPQTLLAWAGYSLLTLAFNFANSWTPTIIEQQSGSSSLGVWTTVLFNFGGALGAAVFGIVAIKVASRRLLVFTLIAAAIFYALFGTVIDNVPVAMVVGVFSGLAATAGIAGIYSIGPALYGTAARGSGMGALIGVGRLVSIAAPIAVGYLLTCGFTPSQVFQTFALPLLISAGLFVLLGTVRKRRGLDPQPRINASDDLVPASA